MLDPLYDEKTVGAIRAIRDAIKALSSLPTREVLLAQVLSAMNAVPTALVTALSDVPRRMVNVVQAIKDKKEAEA